MKTKILTGDVRQVLRRQPANSFDACFCDPPYGLSFMGKAWDHGVPDSEVWAQVLRVLKPGAPLMAFGGTRTFHRLACAIEDAGFQLSDTLCWLHGQGFPKGHAQLKPAWEPITLAWKKGPRVLAIDAARIGPPTNTIRSKGRNPNSASAFPHSDDSWTPRLTHAGRNDVGRWPANVLLDEEAAPALDAQSGILTSGSNPAKHRASRFFYCAKASRSERNAGLEGMPTSTRLGSGALWDGKRNTEPRQNTHPTVKPIKLAEYLARLILPPERDTPRRLLVPFAGSGSEMIGARKAGWDEITGIELSAEYVEIAAKRMRAAA